MNPKTRTILEIDGRYLRLVQASAGKITHCRLAEIAGLDDAKISKQLLTMARDRSLDWKRSQTVLAVARHQVIVRYLDLPSSDREEIRSMVQLQALQQIPYNPDDVAFDFVVLSSSPEGRARVMIVFVLKEIIRRLWGLCSQAGIFPSAITLSTIGIDQWYRRSRYKHDSIAVVMDISAHQSEICICDYHRLLTSRQVPLGMESVNGDQWDNWLKHIDLTVDGYNQDKLGSLPTKIVLIGPRELGSNFVQYLRQQYSLPVEVAPSLDPLMTPQAKSLSWPKDVLQKGVSMTAVLGLGISGEDPGINLLPQDLLAQQERRQAKASLIRTAAAGAIALLMAGAASWMHFNKKSQYLAGLKDDWKNVNTKLQSIEQKTVQLEALNKTLNDRVLIMELVQEVYRTAPQGISLFNITLTPRRLMILQGVTYKAGDVNQFQDNLVRSPMFTNVTLDYMNKRMSQNREINYFKLTCQIK